jgi:hypothetical protein
MKKAFSPTYRQHYFEGYSIGLNPYLEFNSAMKTCIYNGFNAGRSEQQMNGLICNGIPQRIVTDMILEDFLIAGLLGLP